jgi:putative oxidoreductase
MKECIRYVIEQASPIAVDYALLFMRVAIGILTLLHGLPKMGGVSVWHSLGTTFMYPLGIHFWPTLWGFLGFLSEFGGGILLVLGLGTRVASVALIIMMIIATAWHINKGDSFNVYSLPLTLIVVYAVFMVIGSGPYSVDAHVGR